MIIVLIDVLISVLLVIYIEVGEFEEYLIYLKNLDMVVMDMVIIVKVLVCLLVFGMGDVFFIWFEVKVCYDVCVISMVGG